MLINTPKTRKNKTRDQSIWLSFGILDVGADDFKKEVLARSYGGGKTQFISLSDFLPDFQPKRSFVQNLERRAYTIEQANKATAFLSLLTHWSTFTNQKMEIRNVDSNLKINKSKSSSHRRLKFCSVQLLKWFVESFLLSGGKIQLSDKAQIRFWNKDIEDFVSRHKLNNRQIYRDHNDQIIKDAHSFESVFDSWFEFLCNSVDRKFNRPTVRNDLFTIWEEVGQGMPPHTYKNFSVKYQTYDEVMSWLRLENEQQADKFVYDLTKHLYKSQDDNDGFISRCSRLNGRKVSIVCGANVRLEFNACYKCTASKVPHTVCNPRENVITCQSSIRPLNVDLAVKGRNEFSSRVKKKIKKRDGDSCLICLASGKQTGCTKFEVGHIHSAFYTSYDLTEVDGFMICAEHNKQMNTLSLNHFCPEAISYVKEKYSVDLNVNLHKTL